MPLALLRKEIPGIFSKIIYSTQACEFILNFWYSGNLKKVLENHSFDSRKNAKKVGVAK